MSEREMDEMMNSEFAKLDLRTAKSLHASNKLNRTRNQAPEPIYYSIDQVKQQVKAMTNFYGSEYFISQDDTTKPSRQRNHS